MSNRIDTGDLGPSPERQAFRKCLIDHLARQKMSAAELARRAGISKDAVSSYTKMRSLPTPATLAKIAGALNCSPKVLQHAIKGAGAVSRLAILECERPGYKRLVVSMAVPTAVAASIFQTLAPATASKNTGM